MKIKRSILIVMAFVFLILYKPSKSYGQKHYSSWSRTYLEDVRRLGLYDYKQNKMDLKSQIKEEDLGKIIGKIGQQIEERGLVVNKDFKEVEILDKESRLGVLNGLYNKIARYYSQLKVDNLDYYISKGILEGSDKGLRLEDKATREEALIFASRMVKDLYRDEGLTSKGLVWKLSNKGKEAYILGTLDLASSKAYPLAKDLEEIINKSDIVMVENDLFKSRDLNKLRNLIYTKENLNLENKMNKDKYKKLYYFLGETGLDRDGYKNLKPWALGILISDLVDMEDKSMGSIGSLYEDYASYSLDLFLQEKLKSENRLLEELVGLEYVVETYNGLSNEEQIIYLEQMISRTMNDKKLDEPINKATKEKLDEIIDLWSQGAESKIEDVISSPILQVKTDYIFPLNREEKIINSIRNFLEEDNNKTGFIILKVTDCIGDNSILNTFKEMGYNLESLNEYDN